MCAIGRLGWSACWCRLCNGGSILRNGRKLLFPKGQPGWAGSLLPMPALFLVVRSLLFNMRNITYLNTSAVKKVVKRRLLFIIHYAHPRVDQWLRVVTMCCDQPLRLHYPSGLELIRKQCLDKANAFKYSHHCIDLTDGVEYSVTVAQITGMHQESTTNSADD